MAELRSDADREIAARKPAARLRCKPTPFIRALALSKAGACDAKVATLAGIKAVVPMNVRANREIREIREKSITDD